MDTQAITGNGNAAVADTTLTSNFQKVLNSGVRLSGAASLYSLQQLETAVSNLQSGKGFNEQFDRVQGYIKKGRHHSLPQQVCRCNAVLS